jgi:3-oxoacyl-[acyl-carrier protein] reductase
MRALTWGRMISLSSAAAQIGGVIGPHYAAYLAKEGIKEGITVNAIAPCPVSTEIAAGLQ